MKIFGDGGLGEAAHLLQGGAPEDRPGAAVEAGVVDIPPRLHHVVEHLLLVGDVLPDAETLLEQIRVVEVMGRLDLDDIGVPEEPDSLGEEGADRDVVGVQRDHQLGVAVGQAVVEIAGLGA